MTLPSAPNSISMSQVNTELVRSSTASINLNESAVRTLAGVASGAISMNDLRGKSSFTLAFNSAVSISVINGQQTSSPLEAAYEITTSGTCNKIGATSYGNAGPTAWGSPTGGSPGNSFETRLYIDAAYVTPGYGNYARFAGVNIADGFVGYTSWYSLSVARSLVAYCAGQSVVVSGTLYIRNTSSLAEISRAIYVGADQTV